MTQGFTNTDEQPQAVCVPTDLITPYIRRADHWTAIWILVAFSCLGFGGLIFLSRIVPLPSPSKTVADVAAMYHDHPLSMKLGLVMCILGSASFYPIISIIFLHMRRIEGPWAFWSFTMLTTGAVGPLFAVIGVCMLLMCAYRPDYDPRTVYLLNDMGWHFFTIFGYPFLMMQQVCASIVIFMDKMRRVFPRWLAYLGIWDILIYLTSFLVPFFHSGPFAWSGVFGFYLPAVAATVWMVSMIIVVMRRRPEA